MSETVITVRGVFESFHPAERCTVTVAVGFEGPQRTPVVESTTAGTRALVAGITAQHDPHQGPITWHATDRIRVWSTRPYNDKGDQRPLVHHAQTTTRAKFRDFDALAHWVEAAARHDGVRIDVLEWSLTELTRQRVIDEVRTAAVRDARAKATQYAEALGLTSLRCVALADPGMLGDHSQPTGPGGPAMFSRAAGGAPEPEGLSFTPEDIAVAASVDARFLAI